MPVGVLVYLQLRAQAMLKLQLATYHGHPKHVNCDVHAYTRITHAFIEIGGRFFSLGQCQGGGRVTEREIPGSARGGGKKKTAPKEIL